MTDDSFVCKKCGDLLRDPLIATYRAVISSGGSVSGAIRCGRCGYIYSPEEIIPISSKDDLHLNNNATDLINSAEAICDKLTYNAQVFLLLQLKQFSRAT